MKKLINLIKSWFVSEEMYYVTVTTNTSDYVSNINFIQYCSVLAWCKENNIRYTCVTRYQFLIFGMSIPNWHKYQEEQERKRNIIPFTKE